MNVLKCRTCQKELTNTMEIEFCGHTNDYFCNPDCASTFYFDYMKSNPIDLTDREDLENDGVLIKRGKLYQI